EHRRERRKSGFEVGCRRRARPPLSPIVERRTSDREKPDKELKSRAAKIRAWKIDVEDGIGINLIRQVRRPHAVTPACGPDHRNPWGGDQIEGVPVAHVWRSWT